MKNLIVKVCGMRDSANIRTVAAMGVDWIGLVFNPQSERNVTMISTHAGIIPDRASNESIDFGAGKVGVFTDEMGQNIITRTVNFKLTHIQFDGNEPPTLLRNLRRTLSPDMCPDIRFIKTIRISQPEDMEICKEYEDCADYFLFEAPSVDINVSAARFDWHLLDAYDGQTPFILGDISPEDGARINMINHPRFAGINLTEHFDAQPGMKNTNVLRNFLLQIRK